MHKSRIHLKHSNNSDNGDLDADMLVNIFFTNLSPKLICSTNCTFLSTGSTGFCSKHSIKCYWSLFHPIIYYSQDVCIENRHTKIKNAIVHLLS